MYTCVRCMCECGVCEYVNECVSLYQCKYMCVSMREYECVYNVCVYMCVCERMYACELCV